VTLLRLATALFLLMLLASPLRAGDTQTGIASMWGGPGAASHDCVFPWTACQTRAVRSLDTGVVIIVTPRMYCDCFVGRVGPNGETERLIDLDPAMVAALGLDPVAGLFRVEVWPVDATSGQPDGGVPDTAVGQP
jgi:hypothetical protein